MTLQHISSFLLSAASTLAFSQTPAYLHYDVNDGLPSALVYCMSQDNMGVMWFGSDKGLVRFDGSRFKTFNIKDGLPDNEVLNMYEDSHGRLWISCLSKKPCYEQNGQIFTAAQDPMLGQLDMNTGTFVFAEDGEKSVWIAGDIANFCKVSNGKATCFSHNKIGADTYGGSLHSIKFIEKSMFGFDNSAIHKFSPEGKVECSFNFRKKPISQEIVAVGACGRRVLCSKADGLILLEYDGQGFQKIDELNNDIKGNVLADKSGRFWVASQSGGVYCFDHLKHALSKPMIYLPDEKITSIFEDKEGTFWFSTYNAGIYALPKNAAITFSKTNEPQFQSTNLTSITKLSNGDIAVGDDAGKVYQYNNKKWTSHNLNPSKRVKRVLQIAPLPHEDWLAVTDKGVYSKKMGRLDYFENHGAPKSLCSNDREIWLGTSHFLLLKTKDSIDVQTIKHRRFMSLCMDGNNNLWAGGLNGLYSQKDQFNKKWGELFKPIASRIIDIELALDGSLWVATPDYGLLNVRIKDGEVQNVQLVNDSLESPIENIQSIFQAKDGKIWLATNSGVYSLSKSFQVNHFDKKNGLIDNTVNAIFIEDDTLWAATASGLSKLQLKQQGELGNFPTRFAAVRYNIGSTKYYFDLLSLPPEKPRELTLPAGITLLEVELAGLRYRNRGNLQFEYSTQEKLLPLNSITFRNLFSALSSFFAKKQETDLVEAAVRNFGVNVTPGRYFTTVTAILPDGTRSTQPDFLTITVLPPWWQTVWFILALVALAAFALRRALRAREDFQNIQNTNSALQLQALRAQMNPHFIGNSINAIQQFFYPPDPVKASEYISIFSDLLRRTLYFTETDFITLKDELEYLNDYLKMIKLRFGDRFSYDISGTETLPEGTPFPAMLLQPILENATIHGLAPIGNSHLKIEFGLNADRLECYVTDNGVGIEASLARKQKQQNRPRPSKGILMIEKKIKTLNKLYPLDIRLDIADLSKKHADEHGTRVTFSFLSLKHLPSKYAQGQEI